MITISLYCQQMDKNNSTNKKIFYFSRPSPFPQLNYVGFIGIIVSIVQFFTGNYTQAGFLLVISTIIMFMRSWSRLNLKNNTLTDFFAIIPYRNVNLKSFHRILLTKETVNRTLNSRGSTSTINYLQYKIIVDSDHGRLILKEGKNKTKLMAKAINIARAASVVYEDRS